jgi:hypothetical protein
VERVEAAKGAEMLRLFNQPDGCVWFFRLAPLVQFRKICRRTLQSFVGVASLAKVYSSGMAALMGPLISTLLDRTCHGQSNTLISSWE